MNPAGVVQHGLIAGSCRPLRVLFISQYIFVSESLKKRRLVISLLSATAGVLILIGSYLFFFHNTEPRDTFSDPELAYIETLKILYDVSSRLNQGKQAIKPVGKIHEVRSKSFEIMNKPETIFKEDMNNLKYIHKAMDMAGLHSNENINN